MRPMDSIDELFREGCDSAQSLEEIGRHAFPGQQRPGLPPHLRRSLALAETIAITMRTLNGQPLIQEREHVDRDIDARQHQRGLGHKVSNGFPVDRNNGEGGNVTPTDIFFEKRSKDFTAGVAIDRLQHEGVGGKKGQLISSMRWIGLNARSRSPSSNVISGARFFIHR